MNTYYWYNFVVACISLVFMLWCIYDIFNPSLSGSAEFNCFLSIVNVINFSMSLWLMKKEKDLN